MYCLIVTGLDILNTDGIMGLSRDWKQRNFRRLLRTAASYCETARVVKMTSLCLLGKMFFLIKFMSLCRLCF